MRAVEELVEVSNRIREIQECLNMSEPELCAELKQLEAKKQELSAEAKTELREKGIGSWTIGGRVFKVASGGTKKVYRTAEIEELAEERGDTELLMQYRVFTRQVDPSQISRLPEEVRARYESLCDVVTQTVRVSFPKDLE
jgi:hypothetical protein